jgi:hypothetical protein
MSFTTLTHWSEFASMLLAVLLSIALIALFLRAYVRSRKALFLLLIAANAAYIYMNGFAAIVSFYGAAHVRLFSPAAMHFLGSFYLVTGAIGEVLNFIGMIFLIRLALSQCGTPQT